MKGNLFIMAMLGLSIFQLDAQKQINCLIHPTTINAGLDGWNLEWDEGTFILQTEDDVINLQAQLFEGVQGSRLGVRQDLRSKGCLRLH